MQRVDRPVIIPGTVEQDVKQIKTYLLKSNEQLNAILTNLTIEKILEQIVIGINAPFADNSNKSIYKAVQDSFGKIIKSTLANTQELTFKDITLANLFAKNSIETMNAGTRYFGKTSSIDIGDGYLCFANGIFTGYKAKESGT